MIQILRGNEDGLADIEALVRPESIAIVGATDTPGTPGCFATENLVLHSQFEGTIHLVALKRDVLFGRSTVSSLDDIADDIDVVLIVTPRVAVIDVVEAAQRRNTKFVVIVSSGFSEMGEEGHREQARLVAALGSGSTRAVGPNTAGYGDIAGRLGVTIQPGFHRDLLPGRIGLVVQSGGLARGALQSMQRGVGFSKYFVTGNQLDIDLADYVNYLAKDPDTAVVAVIAESVPSGERFVSAVQAVHTQGKEIVLLKSGRSESGRLTAMSHTGAIIGSSRALEALSERYGIHLVRDLGELVDVAVYLASDVEASGPRVGVYSMSGGAGVVLADALDDESVPLASLSAETSRRLAGLTTLTTARNPVDIGGAALVGDNFAEGLEALAEDPDVGVVLAVLNAWYEGRSDDFLAACEAVATRSGVPVVPVWMSDQRADAIDGLESRGTRVVRTARSAAIVAQALGRVSQAQHRSAPASRQSPDGDAKYVRSARAFRDFDGEMVLEQDVKQILADCDLRVTRERTVATHEDALDVANQIGYPVILKVVDERAPHRAGSGLVSVRIDTADELLASWDGLREAANSAFGSTEASEVLVSEFVTGGVEAYIGIKRDPEWGLLLSVGLGGSQIEALGDVGLAPLPASREQIDGALDGTRLRTALDHANIGSQSRAKFLDIAIDVAEISLASERILEIDLNPVIIRSNDVVVVDGLVNLSVNGGIERG